MSVKTVVCSFTRSMKSTGVNKSYPTEPGVARRGVITCGVNLRNLNPRTGAPRPPPKSWRLCPGMPGWYPVDWFGPLDSWCPNVSHTCGRFGHPGTLLGGSSSFGWGGYHGPGPLLRCWPSVMRCAKLEWIAPAACGES